MKVNRNFIDERFLVQINLGLPNSFINKSLICKILLINSLILRV